MREMTLPLASIIVLSVILGLGGCALDPMEKLSEDIDSEDVQVRAEAVLALANLRDDRAIDALGDVLESDEELCDMAGVALVKQGRETVTDKKPDPVITRVANIMNNVHNPLRNRARAAWVLGEIGDREAIPALRTGAGALNAAGEAATPVQDQAKLSLKKLGDSSEGAAFELPMGTFKGGDVLVLPEVKPIEVPKEEEEEEATGTEKQKGGEKPGAAKGKEGATKPKPGQKA